MGNINHPAPPDGYKSWLDFAVETFDTRGLWVAQLFGDDLEVCREAMREAARAELGDLRAATAAQTGTTSV